MSEHVRKAEDARILDLCHNVEEWLDQINSTLAGTYGMDAESMLQASENLPRDIEENQAATVVSLEAIINRLRDLRTRLGDVMNRF